jgi:multidrug resistance protein
VWWDEPVDQDPQNPMNWGAVRKWVTIAILVFITFLTSLASSFFAPAVPLVMKDFNDNNELLAEFVVSIYVLGFAFGPLIIAPLSEIYGRAPLYISCNILFIIFSVACSLSTNMSMLTIFRFLLGCAGAAPLTLGGGTIADIIPPGGRRGPMAIWAMGPVFGPVIGPICGVYLSHAKGWRWTHWVLAMVFGAASIIALILLKETYPPVILARKVARLRKVTGNQELRSRLDSDIRPKEVFKRAIFRPIKILLLSPIVGSLSWCTALAYGLLYLLFTTYTFVFEDIYHFSTGTVGLSFIGTCVGFGLALLVLATTSIVIKQKATKPEHHIPLYLIVPICICLPAGLFLYGWTMDKDIHWIVPLFGTAMIGFAILGIFVSDDFLAF